MKYIYGLVDPRDRSIRYVGQTTNLNRRHIEHIEGDESTAKGVWIRELRLVNLQPDIVLLERVAIDTDASYHEKWWITFGEHQGWKLTNTGNPTNKKLSFGDLFSEHLRREYDAFLVASRSGDPLVMITRAQFSAFVLLLKMTIVFAISIFAGYAIWSIQYSTIYDEAVSLFHGGTVAISCLVMGTLAAFGLARQHKFEIVYISLVLASSLYVTFGG